MFITIADGVVVGDCVLPGGRCGALQFTTPDTSALLAPDGLAGPAQIIVRDASNALVADIGTLFATTTACDRQPENVFRQLTVLPKPNSYADAANGIATTLRATVDGSGSLLLPLDYWGGGTNSVLAETPGAPVAVFLEGGAEIPAMGAGDPNTIQQVLAAQATPSDFVRSFTLNGRPLPPLLRITNEGNLFGTSDTIESVLRIARNDGIGGPNLFDLSDRLSAAGRGPIIISSFDAQVNEPVPLQGLRSTSGTVAYTRQEAREATNLNSASGDADTADHVCQVIDAVAGVSTNTGQAVTQVSNGYYAASALVTSDGLTAFLESESAQNGADLDGDVRTAGNILRVFDDTGTDLTSALDISAALGRLVDERSLAISGAKVFFRTPGELVGALSTGVAGPVFPGPAHGIAMSADTAHVYVTAGVDWVSVLSRDALTGALTPVDLEIDGVAGVSGIDGAAGIAISPDGAHVYVAGHTSDSVAVFSRDAMTGVLTFVEAQFNGMAGVSNLDGPRQLAISPDGGDVYAAAELGHAIVVFSRNAGTGALTFVEADVDDVNGVDGIRYTYDVVVSPDGAHLYAIGRGDNAVAAFSRDAGTGALTFVEAQFDNPFSDRGFRDPRSVAVSRDGARVYATGSGITAFERNTTSGALTQLAATYDVDYGTEDVAVSGDRAYVYGVTGAGTSLAAFRIDPVTDEMTLLHTSINGVGGVAGMTAAQTLVLTPDGSHVYVNGGAGEVALFGTRQSLGVFDTATLALLSPQPAAERVAAAGERAVILTPESSAGIDLNGDADALTGGDLVAQLYDASGPAPALTNLGVAANRIAIGSGLVALTVREANENQSSAAGQDLNDDGDRADDVLAWYAVGAALPPHNLGVAANKIAIAGSRIVFTTPESNEGPGGVGCAPTIPPGGCDLNGDDDAFDWVLRIYRQDTDEIVNVGFDASDFVISGNYVAFRTSEDSQGSTDFNGDGGAHDSVMFVYNLVTGEIINTAITAFPCDLPGCEPSIPYKIKGETVSFLTWEPDEGEGSEGSGRDRNGDGDVDDVVLTVYSVPSRTAQFVATVIDGYESVDPLAPAPFPTEDVGDGTIVYVTAKESAVGEDVNGDGVIDDSIVVLVTGDADEDGTFDDLDTCLTAPNPEQTDFDGDQLGDDTCDPNIECPPRPLDGCRSTTEPGKSKLTIKSSSKRQ